MKKHLIALAIAGAVSAPTMAQVTIYGTIGTAWVSTETTGGDAVSDSSNGDQLGSSVFGFKGSEDLGGGLKADFALEREIFAGSGATAVSGTFDEKALVGLSGSFGRVSFGMQGTTYDSHKSHGNMGANLFSATDQALDDLTGPTAETLRYDSPSFSGLSFSVSTSNAIAAEDINAFAVSYKMGDFGFTYSKAENNADESEETFNFSFNGIPGLGLNAQIMQGEDGTTILDQQAWKLGANYKLSGKVNVLASIQNYSDSRTTADEDAMGVMGVYNFSKRTAAFAGYNIRDIVGADTTVTTVGIQHKF